MPIVRSLTCMLLSLAAAVTFAGARPPATQPSSALPFEVIRETQKDPLPQRIYVVKIDLTDPRVGIRVVPGGPDPDGAGPWQTTLAPVSEIAKREGLDLAINASFFSVRAETDDQGKKVGYRAGVWASAVGRTVTDGEVWSTGRNDWPVLWIDSSGRARLSLPTEIEGRAQQVVAGNAWILKDGKDAVPTEGMMTVRHPRTAVGIDRDGKTLILLSVDGRRPLSAVGMTGAELREELIKHGAHDAINLDGGGSTTLVQRSDDGHYDVINTPSDGRERPVANAIGVTVKD